MDLDTFSTLPLDLVRAQAPALLSASVDDAHAAAAARESVQALLADAPDSSLQEALDAFSELGSDWVAWPAITLFRDLSRAYMPLMATPRSVVGADHLAAVSGQRQLWICNHRSYVDTQVTDLLLAEAGVADIDRMLVVAGPKVYSSFFRRAAAAGLNTLMTPQSSTIQTNDAPLSPREVAALAVRCVKAARDWDGPVLLYPEGTRTRTGRLGSFIKAAARYTRGVDVIVPMALSGSDQLFGMDERMRPGPITLRIGAPFAPPKGKVAPLEQAWASIAALLPADEAPEQDTPAISS